MRAMFCETENSRSRQGGPKKNVGKHFLDSLELLMKGFLETSQHFIRCLNPNRQKSNTAWEVPHVVSQLRCSGLIPALKVVKKGYPTRMAYDDLERNYRKLISHPILEDLSTTDFWKAALVGFGFPTNQYEFGLTKVIF